MIDQRKITEVIIFLASQPRMDRIRFTTTLFLSDMSHLIAYGRSITGDGYIRTPEGVEGVVSDSLIHAGLVFHDDPGFSISESGYLVASREPNMDELSTSDIQILKEVVAELSPLDNAAILTKVEGKTWQQAKPRTMLSVESLVREFAPTDAVDDLLEHLNIKSLSKVS